MIHNAEEQESLYYMKEATGSSTLIRLHNSLFSSTVSDSSIRLWHNRLDHPSFRYLKLLYPHLFVNKRDNFFQCEQCILSKQTRTPHPIHSYKPTKPFYLVHSDVWGPTKIPNLINTWWFVTFIDDHIWVCWVFLLKEKSDVYTVFKRFHHMILNIFQTSIHILRSDNGREYFSAEFDNYLSENGIIHQSTCSYTPQQNGMAERKNRHLLEIARNLMFTSQVPSS